MLYSINAISNYFIKKGIEEKFEGISPLKLQKLLYYAQAWHCVLREEELFDDEIQAWVHGPVVKKVYDEYKRYGYHPITDYKEEAIEDLSLPTQKVLEAVWNMYGGLTAKELEKLTHSEAPWKQARGELDPLEPAQTIISVDSLIDYYGQFVSGEA